MTIGQSMLAGAAFFALGFTSAWAQQVSGTLGAPGATTTITGKQLPSPSPAFGGLIKEKASESTPWWAPRVVPPKGAPNVLLIMTDDQGFGAPSTFGGVIPTPAMDRIAKEGLRFTNFHSTSLCSLFDEGWNKVRETIFANQKRLGIMPENAKLTPWPEGLPQWDSLSLEAKKLFIRQADVYAAYLAYADNEIGRVIQAVEDIGELDNTLIIYIGGDNGASAEGMLNGTPNEFTTFNGVDVPVKDQFLWYPFWGSERTFPHFAAGWAWAMGTPFKWVKQVPSHFGGTAQGMVMSWPGHINDAGGVRAQFHHFIDIVPTILEATGIPQPETINGIKQEPIEGVSMAYTWDKANAAAPTEHKTQYFEMLGNRAIYHDGWVAATTPATLPWELSTKTPPDVITGYNWELYNVDEDPTQFTDLAAKMPDKLKELQDLFYAEAKKYNVLPLDNSTLARWNAPRPNLTAGRTEFTYRGELSGVPASAAPSTLNKSYTITADVEIPDDGAQGMIVTEGGRFGGYGLFLSQGDFGVGSGKVVFLYNLLDLKRTLWEGPELEPGKHRIVFDFKSDGKGLGAGGTGVLSVDGKEVARNSIDHGIPVTFPEDETFDVGLDTRTGVALLEHRYDTPFRFTGKIDKLTFELKPNATP